MSFRENLETVFHEVFAGLKSAKLIDESFEWDESTILVGESSPLDSIAFVSLLTDLEEKIDDFFKKQINIVIDEIPEMDIDNPKICVGDLKTYVEKLLNE